MDKKANCPVCGSDNLATLYTIDSSQAAGLFLNHERERSLTLKVCIERLWKQKNSSFHACRNCSFEFAWPFVAGDAEIYSLIYHSQNNYPADKWEYRETYKNIDEFARNRKDPVNVIEIGAGNGSFIKGLISRKLPVERILTTEYSGAGAQAIESLGIRCLQKDFVLTDKEELGENFHIICLFQVLEHMTSLHEFFAKINGITNPGARLFISVPNNIQRKFFDRFKLYYDLPPVHIGRFNLKCLNELSIPYGWYIIDHKIQPTSYTQRLKKFLVEQFGRRQAIFASEKLNMKFPKLFFRYSIYLFIVISNFRIITGLRKSNLGTAQWFALERKH